MSSNSSRSAHKHSPVPSFHSALPDNGDDIVMPDSHPHAFDQKIFDNAKGFQYQPTIDEVLMLHDDPLFAFIDKKQYYLETKPLPCRPRSYNPLQKVKSLFALTSGKNHDTIKAHKNVVARPRKLTKPFKGINLIKSINLKTGKQTASNKPEQCVTPSYQTISYAWLKSNADLNTSSQKIPLSSARPILVPCAFHKCEVHFIKADGTSRQFWTGNRIDFKDQSGNPLFSMRGLDAQLEIDRDPCFQCLDDKCSRHNRRVVFNISMKAAPRAVSIQVNGNQMIITACRDDIKEPFTLLIQCLPIQSQEPKSQEIASTTERASSHGNTSNHKNFTTRGKYSDHEQPSKDEKVLTHKELSTNEIPIAHETLPRDKVSKIQKFKILDQNVVLDDQGLGVVDNSHIQD